MTAGQAISTPVTRARVAEMADAWQSDWIEAVVDIRPRDGKTGPAALTILRGVPAFAASSSRSW